MKNYYASVFILLLVNLSPPKSLAQWTTVYQDINAQFYDAAFPTDQTGYVAASDSGGAVLLRTTDGGITWNKKYIFGWGFIDKIAMVDSLTGYIIKGGAPGKIIKTYDGFTSYSIHNTDSSFIVQALALLSDSTGFFLNNAARLRKFENNGSTIIHVIDTLFDGQNLQFVDSHTGYFDTGSGLLKTTDAGATWNYVNTNLGFYCVRFSFADTLNGYFSDAGAVYKTADGGLTFPQQFNFPNIYNFAVRGDFCMAANDSGNVVYTTDGGITWQAETTGINLVAPEPYEVVTTPGGYCYLFGQICGEIRKREPVVTGISDPSRISTVSFYPNPASDVFIIRTDKLLKEASLSLYNSASQKVRQIDNISGNTVVLKRNNLPDGLYYFILTGENQFSRTGKLILSE